MFSDLVSLFNGWYFDYISQITLLISQTSSSVDQEGNSIVSTVVPELWSAYVPWEALIAAAVLCILIVTVFKTLRALLCKM